MRLAITLVVATACLAVARAEPRPLLGDLMKATKSMADSANDLTKSSLQGASNAASGAMKMSHDAVHGAVKNVNKIVRSVADKEYYSLKYLMDLYKQCYFKICMPDVFNKAAKAECEAIKKKKCKEVDDYSFMDFISYHMTQMWLKMTGGAVLNSASSMTNNALKMGRGAEQMIRF